MKRCSAPEHANGGQPCLGESQQWKNCTSTFVSDDIPENCLLGSPRSFPSLSHSSSTRPLFDSQLLAGCIAILLLLVALLAALLFFARKKRTKRSSICGENIGTGMLEGIATGIFLDSEEKLYFPSVAVATTTKDGNHFLTS